MRWKTDAIKNNISGDKIFKVFSEKNTPYETNSR